MHLKFLHTADLHLDTPFKGLGEWNPWLAGKLKNATFKSFSRITDLAISENVDFVLIAGDVFDSENMSLAAQLKFVAELRKLSENGINSYFICGNHDHLTSWDRGLSLPSGTVRFDSSEVRKITHYRKGEAVADIYGISYQNSYVKEDLSLKYHKTGSAAPFSIALLHGMADIAGKDERYAPFSVKNILEKSFDYWALGHVHKRRILNEDPPVVYPGNPQGRDFGETGKKGCYIVEMETGRKPVLSFTALQYVRFEEIELDITGHEDVTVVTDLIDQEIDALMSSDRNTGFIFRVLLTGRTGLHRSFNIPGEARQLAEELNSRYPEGDLVSWIDSIELMTRPPVDPDSLKEAGDFTAALIRSIERYEEDRELIKVILEKLTNELPRARIIRETGQLSESESYEILERSKWMLLDRLAGDRQDD